MAQQSINVGTSNQGDGDTLRDAFVKVNENFSELYSKPTLPVYSDEPSSANEGELAIARSTGLTWSSLASGNHIVVYLDSSWQIVSTL